MKSGKTFQILWYTLLIIYYFHKNFFFLPEQGKLNVNKPKSPFSSQPSMSGVLMAHGLKNSSRHE